MLNFCHDMTLNCKNKPTMLVSNLPRFVSLTEGAVMLLVVKRCAEKLCD